MTQGAWFMVVDSHRNVERNGPPAVKAALIRLSAYLVSSRGAARARRPAVPIQRSLPTGADQGPAGGRPADPGGP